MANDGADGRVLWHNDRVLVLPEAVDQFKALPRDLAGRMLVQLGRVANGGGKLAPIQGISEAKVEFSGVAGRAFLKRFGDLVVVGGFMAKKSRGAGRADDQTDRALRAKALIEAYAAALRELESG